MPAYYFNAATGSSLAIKAVTYEIRIIQFEFNNQSQSLQTGPFVYSGPVYRVPSASISGGSSAFAAPLREGAPATTALCYSGASASGTLETPAFWHSNAGPAHDVWTPAEDLTAKPGSAIVVNSNSNLTIFCYYEELRLSWQY